MMMEKRKEKCSEEVQDIIDRMPTQWTTWLTLLLTILAGVLFTLSCCIEYPDTVSGNISITGEKAPVRLVAVSSGRLHLFCKNQCIVKKGSTIGYIENGANYKDIQRAELICTTELAPSVVFDFDETLILGDLESVYNSFKLSYLRYDQLRHSDLYSNMRRSLDILINADHHVVKNIQEEISLRKKLIENIRGRFENDSMLASIGAMSEEELQKQHNALMQQLQTGLELKSSYLGKLAEIDDNRMERSKIDAEEQEGLDKAYYELCVSFNALCGALQQWKEQNLLVAPIDGHLEFLGFWRENTFITAGQEIFAVSPAKNKVIGEIHLSSIGAGKVKRGQDVNIKLYDYPFDEFGQLKGKVRCVSAIVNKTQAESGLTDSYLAIVDFPEGTETSYGQTLQLNFETKGIAEIITKPKRLLQRLFDNLKTIKEK